MMRLLNLMSDENQNDPVANQQGDNDSSAAVGDDQQSVGFQAAVSDDSAIVNDQQDSSDDSGSSDDSNISGGDIVIPDEVKDKFPDLVDLVLASESMDDEERNYWFSVLPIMTESQIAELRDILETEKKKLAEIDAKYADIDNETAALTEEDIEVVAEKRKEEQQKRLAAEKEHEEIVDEKAEQLLRELDEL